MTETREGDSERERERKRQRQREREEPRQLVSVVRLWFMPH